MSNYYEYGRESHDTYTTTGLVMVTDEAQLKRFINEHHDDRIWWAPVSESEVPKYDCVPIDYITYERERIIAAQIARALIAKRLAKDAYKAPTLATLWPTGA